MNVLFESIVESESLLSESDKKEVVDAVVDATQDFKSPNDLNAFIEKHEEQQKAAEAKLSGKKKAVVTRAWEFLKYAAQKGVAFVKMHWKKILLLIAICVLGWLAFSWLSAIVAKLAQIWNVFDVNAANMMAPGEALQKAAAANGSSISDGIAHTINQISNWD